jgi:hypothetical protein
MKLLNYRFFLPAGIVLLLLVGSAQIARAQVEQDTVKSDTGQAKQELNQQNQKVIHHYQYDRSTHKYLTTESKRFSVPSQTKHYKPPFTGQKTLDLAMEALHEELSHSITNSRVYRILTKIAPFINNVFVFGYYDQLAPVVGPDNPYLYPQTKKGQAWLNFTNKRNDSGTEGKHK